MLMNFCRKCLKSNAFCSTISNDGFEVTNLTSDSDKGFLAYSCIKPPIHIDFTFICDIKINHILIWPSVGAQKSSGFEISVKSGNEYKRISNGFLSPNHTGVSFYRRDVDDSCFALPHNFLHRYIQLSHDRCINRVKNLRVSILRTENSVPAIGRIEIWGSVSAFSGKETVAYIENLWLSDNLPNTNNELKSNEESSKNLPEILRDSIDETTNVPDCFLDPITWNIMIQPIVLPSGVIIDQSTLEKHGKTEATWGRSLSDPFTGIPFNDSRKPIIASALKARIDKYLLENKDRPDVKIMPRLSGRKQELNSMRNRSLDISSQSNATKSIPNSETLNIDKSTNILEQSIRLSVEASRKKIQNETRAHRLPIIPMCSKRGVTKIGAKTTKIKSFGISAFTREIKAIERQKNKESNLDRSVECVLSNLQRFNENDRVKTRKCLDNCKCISRIFYKLPCEHILCRDVLLSIKNSRCSNCNSEYNSRDLTRIHGEFGLK